MDDRNYLIDTNVLVYYLDGNIPPENALIDDIFRHSFIVSIITKIEFLGWSEYLVDSQALELANEFIGAADVVSLTDDIVDAVIDYRSPSTVSNASSRLYHRCHGLGAAGYSGNQERW